MIGVRRDTGMAGILGQITIYVDGQPAGKVKQNQQIQLEIPRKEASIYVSQGGSHSNELIVKDGQVVEITNSFWLYFNMIFPIVTLSTIPDLLPDNYRVLSYALLLLITGALFYFTNMLKITVIYP